jgi:hypothetical protein
MLGFAAEAPSKCWPYLVQRVVLTAMKVFIGRSYQANGKGGPSGVDLRPPSETCQAPAQRLQQTKVPFGWTAAAKLAVLVAAASMNG